jgi:hypothetical protein
MSTPAAIQNYFPGQHANATASEQWQPIAAEILAKLCYFEGDSSSAVVKQSIRLDSTSSLVQNGEARRSYLADIQIAKRNSWITRFEAALSRFTSLDAEWGGAGFASVDSVAVQNARATLEKIWSASLKPSRVAPTSDGGIAITFFTAQGRISIETFASGEVLASFPSADSVDIHDVHDDDDLESLLERIRQMGQDRPTSSPVPAQSGV